MLVRGLRCTAGAAVHGVAALANAKIKSVLFVMRTDADERRYDRALYYDGLSMRILGRSVRHVMLMHHNLINALFLPDVIRLFEDRGWRIIDAVQL